MAALAGIVFDCGRTLYDPETGDFFPDVAAPLATLAVTYRLAIVSLVSGEGYTARRAAREALLRERDLARHFATIYFGARDKERLYREALAALDLAACRVAWGNRHGATTIWFRNGRFRDALPDAATEQPTHTIATLAALPAVLGTTATAARGASGSARSGDAAQGRRGGIR